MRKSTSGFTLVELIIVIVVIGILAAIILVAYNGITQQARVAKTLSAIDGWAKAIRVYKAQTGDFPTKQSCLGSTTTYDGDGFCWGTSYWEVKPAFLSQMDPYIDSYPEPDTTFIGSGMHRGAFYIIRTDVTPNEHNIRAMFAGEDKCPASSVGPLTPKRTNHAKTASGVWCEYTLD